MNRKSRMKLNVICTRSLHSYTGALLYFYIVGIEHDLEIAWYSISSPIGCKMNLYAWMICWTFIANCIAYQPGLQKIHSQFFVCSRCDSWIAILKWLWAGESHISINYTKISIKRPIEMIMLLAQMKFEMHDHCSFHWSNSYWIVWFWLLGIFNRKSNE